MFELIVVGLVIGLLVGLTGTGGGALLTPILILGFKVHTMTAIGSDLVASFFMKPVGAIVHARYRTVRKDLVRLLVLGSLPGAVIGVALLVYLGHGRAPGLLNPVLGVALVLSTFAIVFRATPVRKIAPVKLTGEIHPRTLKLMTLALGFFGAILVGFTSVGSGSIMVAGTMILYPELTIGELVGTDLVQAIPLLGIASLGHAIVGDVRYSISIPLALGAIFGVYCGALMSAKGVRSQEVRYGLTVVLFATGLRLIFS